MINTFEKYLEEEVWEPQGVLDDDMPDAFETWLSQLDVEELIIYGGIYAKYVQYETISNIQDKLAQQTIDLHDELKELKK